MFPSEFKGSKIIENAQVPATASVRRCYRRWDQSPRENKTTRLQAGASSRGYFPPSSKARRLQKLPRYLPEQVHEDVTEGGIKVLGKIKLLEYCPGLVVGDVFPPSSKVRR